MPIYTIVSQKSICPRSVSPRPPSHRNAVQVRQRSGQGTVGRARRSAVLSGCRRARAAGAERRRSHQRAHRARGQLGRRPGRAHPDHGQFDAAASRRRARDRPKLRSPASATRTSAPRRWPMPPRSCAAPPSSRTSARKLEQLLAGGRAGRRAGARDGEGVARVRPDEAHAGRAAAQHRQDLHHCARAQGAGRRTSRRRR